MLFLTINVVTLRYFLNFFRYDFLPSLVLDVVLLEEVLPQGHLGDEPPGTEVATDEVLGV